MACVNKRLHSFTCHPHVYPALPASAIQQKSATQISLAMTTIGISAQDIW